MICLFAWWCLFDSVCLFGCLFVWLMDRLTDCPFACLLLRTRPSLTPQMCTPFEKNKNKTHKQSGEAKAAAERVSFLQRDVQRGEAKLAESERDVVGVKEKLVLIRQRDPDMWGALLCCCDAVVVGIVLVMVLVMVV